MKEIKIPKAYIISSFNGPTGLITPKILREIMKPIENNKSIIIDAVFDIERNLERIIEFYFFQDHEINKAKSNEFKNIILKSDWCTFSAKRKLVTHIIDDKKLLKGQEKSNFEKLLGKVMSYRNAFAHGELSTDGKEVRIKYFQGIPQIKTLTEEYFTNIESDLSNCLNIVFKLGNISGATKIIEN